MEILPADLKPLLGEDAVVLESGYVGLTDGGPENPGQITQKYLHVEALPHFRPNNQDRVFVVVLTATDDEEMANYRFQQSEGVLLNRAQLERCLEMLRS